MGSTAAACARRRVPVFFVSRTPTPHPPTRAPPPTHPHCTSLTLASPSPAQAARCCRTRHPAPCLKKYQNFRQQGFCPVFLVCLPAPPSPPPPRSPHLPLLAVLPVALNPCPCPTNFVCRPPRRPSRTPAHPVSCYPAALDQRPEQETLPTTTANRGVGPAAATRASAACAAAAAASSQQSSSLCAQRGWSVLLPPPLCVAALSSRCTCCAG